jgi:hypothetical protein
MVADGAEMKAQRKRLRQVIVFSAVRLMHNAADLLWSL